jgi:hypothetical protein
VLVFFQSRNEAGMTDSIEIHFQGEPIFDMPIRRRCQIGKFIRLWRKGENEFRAAAELPKLLHGHNGRLIANQAELDLALAEFLATLRTHVAFTAYTVTRLDICWQIAAPARDVILALQWARHPATRRTPTLMPDGAQCVYGSDRSSWHLVLYEKAAGILRMELRLTGRPLRQAVDVSKPLEFGKLWRVLQAALAPLTPIRLPEENRHSFACCVAKLPPDHRADSLANYRTGRTPRAYASFAAEVAENAIRGTGFRLANLVGSDGSPPAAVHAPAPNPRGKGRRFNGGKLPVPSPSLPAGTTSTMPTEADADSPHIAGWHRNGTPIYRGTKAEWPEHIRAAFNPISGQSRPKHECVK